MEKSKDLSVLILAAGSSKRLGEPKQLLKVADESLIQIAVKKALNFCENVTVVLGHEAQTIAKEISKYPISLIINPNYEKGMGNSIAFGISSIKKSQHVLIMLCDQPLIPLEHYQALIHKASQNNELIICSKYQERYAVPSIFPKKYFKLLTTLEADNGAKKFLKNNPLDFVLLDDELSIDIDTKEDISVLNSMNK